MYCCRFVGALLTTSSDFCFVLEDSESGRVCGYAAAACDARDLYRKAEMAWLPAMQEKYPKPVVTGNDLTPAQVGNLSNKPPTSCSSLLTESVWLQEFINTAFYSHEAVRSRRARLALPVAGSHRHAPRLLRRRPHRLPPTGRRHHDGSARARLTGRAHASGRGRLDQHGALLAAALLQRAAERQAGRRRAVRSRHLICSCTSAFAAWIERHSSWSQSPAEAAHTPSVK